MLLKNLSLTRIRQIIQSDFPEIKIKSARLIANGWDNIVVEINGEYIFRFPKKKDECRTDVEIKLLKFLKNKISLLIPRIEFFGNKYVYFGYRKIQGVPLTKKILDSLKKEEREKLIFDIANFLFEFHNFFFFAKSQAAWTQE